MDGAGERARVMHVLTIASGKGGTGKTTTAVTLAAIFAEGSARVLVVDLDPQGSASAWLGMGVAGDGLTVLDVLTGDANLEELVRPSPWAGVDVIPSAPALAAADRSLAGQPLAVLGLRKAVHTAPAGRWAWVLIDCPPALGSLTTAAVAAAVGVLAPVEPSALGLTGLEDLTALVDGIGAHVTPAPRLVGVLACRVDSRQRLARAMVETLRDRWGGLVLPGVIRETVRAREAAAARQAVIVYDPNGPAAADYRAAAAEVEKRLAEGDAHD